MCLANVYAQAKKCHEWMIMFKWTQHDLWSKQQTWRTGSDLCSSPIKSEHDVDFRQRPLITWSLIYLQDGRYTPVLCYLYSSLRFEIILQWTNLFWHYLDAFSYLKWILANFIHHMYHSFDIEIYPCISHQVTYIWWFYFYHGQMVKGINHFIAILNRYLLCS